MPKQKFKQCPACLGTKKHSVASQPYRTDIKISENPCGRCKGKGVVEDLMIKTCTNIHCPERTGGECTAEVSLGGEMLDDFIVLVRQSERKKVLQETSLWIEEHGIKNSDGTKMSSVQIEAVSYVIRNLDQRF